MPTKTLVARLREDGYEVSSHMSTLTAAEAAEVEAAIRRPGEKRRERCAQATSRVRVRRRARNTVSEGPEREAPAAKTESRDRSDRPARPRRSPTERAVAAATADRVDPRSRFEQELAAARARTEARRAEAAKARAPVDTKASPDRPRVGDVIELPPRPVRVVERPEPAERRRPDRRERARPRRGRKSERRKPMRRPAEKTRITTPAAHKRVIQIEDTVELTTLAQKMGVKANEVLEAVWRLGMTGLKVNSILDADAADLVASEFGSQVENVAFREEQALGIELDVAELPRRPVVTVMGHVDHGKTTLLDTIRSARVAAGEAGGITQHIAAYRVAAEDAGELVFLDTPGHAAFTAMRARGAQVTDVVVLVVAANDGVMPQTVEAIDHARAAGVPMVVAINKCDAPDARPDQVRSALAERGLIPEEWGGDVQMIEISALTGAGVGELLQAIALQAELLELSARVEGPAAGAIIEAELDKARGPVATVLVTEGTLAVGDVIVAGEATGRVRAIADDRGERIESAGPATPVEILGLDAVPSAGDILNAVDEVTARRVAAHRRERRRKRELAVDPGRSVRDVLAGIEARQRPELPVIVKADVAGSAEALRAALEGQATDRVGVRVISASVGGITESDVHLASASDAVIVGFQVRPLGKAAGVARQHGVPIRTFDVIYEAVDEVRSAMAGLLPPVRSERRLGTAEVRELFPIPRVGIVAGCYVTAGSVHRGARARVVRDGVVQHDSTITSLRRFDDDVAEVTQGYECGVIVEGASRLERGDVLEAYEVVETAPTL